MNKYFISDPHFGHTNILKLERSRFSTIEEHDAYIIERINKTVSLTDTLYILGDIGSLDKARLLNGRKILIMGNHDKRNKAEFESVFAEVYDTPLYVSKRIVLSHEPILVNSSILNAHGHLHGSCLDSDNHFNLSAALIDYTPVEYSELATMAGKLPKESIRFLEEWYADKYVFSSSLRSDVIMDADNHILLAQTIEFRNNSLKDDKGFIIKESE